MIMGKSDDKRKNDNDPMFDWLIRATQAHEAQKQREAHEAAGIDPDTGKGTAK